LLTQVTYPKKLRTSCELVRLHVWVAAFKACSARANINLLTL